MKTWKHLTIEQRKIISNGISHNYKLKEIAETLGFDSTSISSQLFNIAIFLIIFNTCCSVAFSFSTIPSL